MIKYRYALFLMTVAGLLGLAVGQNSKGASSPSKPANDSLRNATKPITPKSAMPAQRKGAVASPKPATRQSSTSTELSRLERQSSKATASKNTSPAPANSTQAKPKATSGNASKIDFKYQKPAGQKPATPGPGPIPNASK